MGAEDALEREKKVKGDVDKAKRKVEGDLKLTQEAVSDLERVKGELQGAAARKDKEGSALAAKIDDEATLGAKYAKQAKELQARLEELDEELALTPLPRWSLTRRGRPSWPVSRASWRNSTLLMRELWLIWVSRLTVLVLTSPSLRRIRPIWNWICVI